MTGPWIAIGAVAAGREAAVSIDRYLDGLDLKADREAPLRPIQDGNWNPIPMDQPKAPREPMPELPQAEWTKGFKELNLGYHPSPGPGRGGPVHQLRRLFRMYAVRRGLSGRGHCPRPAAPDPDPGGGRGHPGPGL